MEQKITLIGMEQFLNKLNDSLFNGVTFPAGIDKTLFINSLMLDIGECEALYANPYYMKAASANWANKWNRTFQKWLNALTENYNPLHNYDRYEQYTDSETSSGTDSSSSTTSNTSSQNAEVNSNSNMLNSIAAFDSQYFLAPKDESDGSVIEYNNVTGNSSQTQSNTGETGTERELSHTAHLYGNIGVTTSQQMLRDELDIQTWNIYQHMIDLYAQELAILVY